MFFLFLSVLFSPTPQATFEFYHTVVEMPLGANPYDYVDLLYDYVVNHYILTSFMTIEDISLQSLFQGYTPMISILILGVVISIFLKKFLSVDSFDKHHQFIYNETTEHTQEN